MRWCRNNPLVAGLLATVALTLVLGTGISSYFAVLADQRADAATENARLARQSEQVATEQTQLALDTITTIIFDINAQLREVPEAGEQRRDILKNAIEQLDSVSRGFENAAEVNSSRAGALINLGDIYGRLGDEHGSNASARSFELYQQSVKQFEQLVDEQGVEEPETLWKYSVALQRVASDLVDSGKVDQAMPYLERCLPLRRRLAEREPTDRRYAAGVIHVLYELGDYWKTRGKYDRAVDSHAEGLQRSEKLFERFPEDREAHSLVVYGHDRLGDAYYSGRNYEQSLEHLQQAFAIYQQLLQKYPRYKDFPFWLSINREYLGNLYYAQRNYTAAERAYRESLAAIQQAIEIDPLDVKLRKSLGFSYDNLCRLYQEQNRLTDLIAALRECLAVRRKEAGLDPGDTQLFNLTMNHYRQLGKAFESRREFDKAAENYEDGIAFLKSLKTAPPQQIQNFETQIKRCRDQEAVQRELR